jgi:hypothetical protein
MVGEAALEQHTDAMLTGNIGGRDQRNVFRRAHVTQVIGLCQYEEPLRLRGLNFRKLPPKILDKHIVQPSGDVYHRPQTVAARADIASFADPTGTLPTYARTVREHSSDWARPVWLW